MQKSYTEYINYCLNNTDIALFRAIHSNRSIENIKYYISDINKKDRYGNNVLHMACVANIELVEFLIINGGFKYIFTPNDNGNIPLLMYKNIPKVIKLLLSYENYILNFLINENILYADDDQHTSLHVVFIHNRKLFSKIIHNNAYLLNHSNNFKLVTSIIINKEYHLLSHIDSMINMSDNNGNTILHYASIHLNDNAIGGILLSGCDLNKMNCENELPIYNVIKRCCNDLIKLFIDFTVFDENNSDIILDLLWKYKPLWFKYTVEKIQLTTMKNDERIKELKNHVLVIIKNLKHKYYMPEIGKNKGGPGYYKMLKELE